MRDASGKTIVITGASSGIGAAAARALARKGARVVITGRSAETTRLASELGCDHFLVDFMKLADVERFARELLAKYPRIDVLVNNVGSVFSARGETGDGHERTLQVNHLSGFLLTNLLRERLEESHATVINTASMAHQIGRIDFDDLESETGYSELRAYGTTKLMNILHAMEISRRFKGVNAASFHPGVVRTGIARSGSLLARWFWESPLTKLFFLSPEKGADTLLWLIEGEPGRDWTPGEFYDKRKPGRKSSQVAPELAIELWDASEKSLKQK
jgi:NAD(P)-dependent dehydrogenase (short-subunit alcohol dehydrogenase family)